MTGRLRRHGSWWRRMGFTRTHLVGVFATETVLCLLGIALALGAAIAEEGRGVRLLLGAIFSVALAIAVLLASILSLLFYAAWPGEADLPEKSDEFADHLA